MKIRFSAILPLYNKAPYIRKALESVLAQSYRDFELIVVDDGSTDNSVAICDEYLNLHSLQGRAGVRLIHQANSGVAAARNNGVKASRGEYVAFLDADDWWEPTFLEEVDKLINEYPDAGLYATNYIYYKPGKTHVALDLPRGIINYPKAYLQGPMPVTSITTCMRRTIFDDMGGFPVGIKLGEDFLLWAKTALHYPIAYCEKPLAYYNNDIPASMRATRNWHAPEHHMLFHLEEIEEIINDQYPISNVQSTAWHALLDKLRINGLMDYWLSDEYHNVAAEELEKVDWEKQPKKARLQYKLPLWWLKAQRRIMQIGSCVKQKIIRIVAK